ncbi:MAG: sialidase family protein [Pirellulaceae bacterium]
MPITSNQNTLYPRRQFIQSTTAVALAPLLTRAPKAFAQSADSMPTAEVIETQIISNFSDAYHGWPTLMRRRNGELLVVCSGGRERHVCPFGRVEMIRSRDDGRTWTFPQVVIDGPIDDRDAGACETPAGNLLVTTFTSLAYEPELQKLTGDQLVRWQGVHQRLNEKQRTEELGVWMLRSEDGGHTWSQRYPCIVNSPHGPVALRDGRILYAGVGLWEKDRRVGVAVSQDDGKSWDWLAEIPVRGGDESKNYHELHLVECASGKLLVHIRNHNTANAQETLQCESTDGGLTWSEPHAIGVWGLPSHLLRLKDDRLLMTYGYRRQPFGNQARLSSDEGKTWSAAMTISADGAGGDLGYPSTVQLDSGELYSVWYERLADKPGAVLRAARWKTAE